MFWAWSRKGPVCGPIRCHCRGLREGACRERRKARPPRGSASHPERTGRQALERLTWRRTARFFPSKKPAADLSRRLARLQRRHGMHAHPADATRTTIGLFFSSAGVDDPARIHLPFVPPASSTTRRTTSQGRLPNFQRFHLASPFRAAPEPASWSFARRHPPVSVRVNFQSAPECHAHRNGDPAEKKTPATGVGCFAALRA